MYALSSNAMSFWNISIIKFRNDMSFVEKRKAFIFISMLIAVLLSGCKKESSKSKIVELSDASSNVILVKDLMSNCQWIQLDSIQEALIGDATRIIEYDEKYYILDIASRK